MSNQVTEELWIDDLLADFAGISYSELREGIDEEPEVLRFRAAILSKLQEQKIQVKRNTFLWVRDNACFDDIAWIDKRPIELRRHKMSKTLDEILELKKKYAKEVLKFDSYYKYYFHFISDNIEVVVGGDRDDIYRAAIDSEMTLEALIYQCGDDYLTIEEVEHE